MKKPPREVLKDIWRRSGLSAAHIARQAGYTSTAGFYNLMQERQGDRPIPATAIKRLIPILRGRGQPPITVDELVAISDATPGSDVAPSSSTVVAMASVAAAGADMVEAFREAPGVMLKIALRAERGTYIEIEGARRQYGVSRIGASPLYRMTDQFAVVVADDHAAELFRRGTVLHVVAVEAFPERDLTGRVAVAMAEKHPGIAEVVVGKIVSTIEGMHSVVDLAGMPLASKRTYVVVGALIDM